MQCRPSSSHSEATHCTLAPSGWRPLQGLFILATRLRHLQSSPLTVRETKGCEIPLRFWIHPFFFHSIFSKTFPPGGPQLYIFVYECDMLWHCGGFLSFFFFFNKQQHRKIIDDPSLQTDHSKAPWVASTTRDSRAVDRCPPWGGVPKNERSGSELWKGKEQGRDKIMFLCDDVCTS